MAGEEVPQMRSGRARTYTLAELAPDLAAADVATWHVAEGALVAAGDDLLDVTTDKAAITIPAPAGGRVLAHHVHPGAPVRATDAIVTLAPE